MVSNHDVVDNDVLPESRFRGNCHTIVLSDFGLHGNCHISIPVSAHLNTVWGLLLGESCFVLRSVASAAFFKLLQGSSPPPPLGQGSFLEEASSRLPGYPLIK